MGKGGFASCFKVIKVSAEKEIYACKVISKESLKPFNRKEKLELEITLQKELNHKNIVKLEHFFEDNTKVYILLEFCPHQSLHDFIKRREYLSELEARYFMLQLIQGVQYMQNKSVLHRDLKLGNVFMGNDMQLKIGDFGLAVKLQRNERRKSFCGTPNYMAPEVVLNNHKVGGGHGQEYGLGVDVWALGLFMFNFIEGKNPFHNGDITRTYNRIVKGEFEFSSD